MMIPKPTAREDLLRKAMAIPLSVVLAAGCAPSAAFAVTAASASGLQDGAAASASAAPAGKSVVCKVLAATASNSASPQALYLPVLLRAVGGTDEFEESYQACGDESWAPSYALFDLGNDGVPELLVRANAVGGSASVHVYTVKSHEVEYLGSYSEGAGSTAGTGDGRLLVAGWAQGQSFVNEVALVNGKVKSKFVSSGQASNAYFSQAGASWIEFSDAYKYVTLKAEGKYEISKATVSVAPAGAYTGDAKAPKVTVKFGGEELVAGADFSVAYRNNVNAGTATATVSGTGCFQGSNSANFAIDRANIASATMSVAAAGAYTGSAKAPAVSAKVGSRALRANADYRVAYRNNVKAGTATATVSGVGNYQGSKNLSFAISKAGNSLSAKAASKTLKCSQVKAKAQTFKSITLSSKGQGKVQYKNVSAKSVSKFFSVNASTGTITAKKGTSKGTYQVKVQVSAAGDGNHVAASKTVTSKVVVS